MWRIHKYAAGLLLVCGTAVAEAGGGDLVTASAQGEQVYARCAGCHSPDRNRAGPMHCGLLGRLSGTVEGFSYSEAMRQAEITWNTETLDAFLENPTGYVPGTSMGISGISDAGQRQALVAWLSTLTIGSALCPPGAKP